MADSIKLDTTVPAYAVVRGSLVHFDIFLKETERQQLSERFAFIKLEAPIYISAMRVLIPKFYHVKQFES